MVKGKIVCHLRLLLSLALVATTMAVACPQPLPQDPPEPEPDTRSQSQILFELNDAVGLYIDNEGVVLYNQEQFQTSRNDVRRVFRLQSDDQTRYMNIHFSSEIPQNLDDSAFCTVTYLKEQGEEMNVIIKLTLVKKQDGMLWFWNDSQQIGVIILE